MSFRCAFLAVVLVLLTGPGWGLPSATEQAHVTNLSIQEPCLGDNNAKNDTGLLIRLFTQRNCWAQLGTKLLGIVIILGACVNKLPVILNIASSRSVEGLSRVGVYGETLVFANGSFYGLLKGYPITAYGENIVMLLQSVVVLLLLWRYTKEPTLVSNSERFRVMLFAVMYLLIVCVLLPPSQHYVLMASVWPVYAYARIAQILKTFQLQHTGAAQSIVTISLDLLGNSIRILTTLKEVGLDYAMLTQFGMGTLLNLVLFVQYWFYQNNTLQFRKQLQAQKGKENKRETNNSVNVGTNALYADVDPNTRKRSHTGDQDRLLV